MRVLPLLIARLTSRPILVKAAHRGLILRINALLSSKSFTYSQYACSVFRCTKYAHSHWLDHARIDPQMPPIQKPVRLKRRETHLKNPLVNLRPEPLLNHAQAAVIGVLSSKPYPRNARTDRLSSQRAAIARSLRRFSKNPTMSILKYTTGSIPGRPPRLSSR